MRSKLSQLVRTAAVVTGLMWGAGTASADTLDKLLADNAKGILEHVSTQKYNTIAVLKFEVQKGGPNGPVYLNLGRMSETMASRLENALILQMDEAKPTGLILGFSRLAAEKDPKATYTTKAGRAALLEQSHPLAWGGDSAKPDAILSGRVTFDEAMEQVTVTIRLFDRAHPETWQSLTLKNASVPVTRQILSDINEPFVVADLVRKRGGDSDVADFSDEGSDTKVKPIPPVKTASTPPVTVKPVAPEVLTAKQNLSELLDFRAYYDGQEVTRTPEGNFPPPKPGQKLHFTARSKERLGLVLLINGINTADAEQKGSKETNQYVKWVLEPNKEYTIRGFYDEKKVYPFEIVNVGKGQARLAGLANPDRIGQIEMHVYRELKKDQAPARSRNISLRTEVAPAKTLCDLKADVKVAIAESQKPMKRGLIVPGAGEDHATETAEFVGALAAKIVMAYSAQAVGALGGEVVQAEGND